jgi:hypothetical protein
MDMNGGLILEKRLEYQWKQWANKARQGAKGYRNIQTMLAIWEVYRILKEDPLKKP